MKSQTRKHDEHSDTKESVSEVKKRGISRSRSRRGVKGSSSTSGSDISESENKGQGDGHRNHNTSMSVSQKVWDYISSLQGLLHKRFDINNDSVTAWSAITLKVLALVLVLVYVVAPAVVKTNPWIMARMIFLSDLRWPFFVDFAKPSKVGLLGSRNFYLESDEGLRLGAWHVLPASLRDSSVAGNSEFFEKSLGSGMPIVLYLHGNAGNRAGWHRVQLYKVLASLNYHVITMDYRGFGDSAGHPTEEGVCHDAMVMYRWIRKRKGNSPLFIWGHSLGTGISTKTVKYLCEEGIPPVGVVLESPFTNIRDAAKDHPLSRPFKILPWFESVFVDSITENNISFSSDQSIASVTPPVMILHATDDGIVPYHLGKKLFETAKVLHPGGSKMVQFVTFPSGHGHKHIHKSPKLPQIIRKYFDDYS